jgi:hypothetical protein
VWLQTHSEGQEDQVQPDVQESQPSDAPTKILVNMEGAPKLEAHTSWDDVRLRTDWMDAPRKLPKAKSGYFSEDDRPVFKQGATLVPSCLVIVDPGSLVKSKNLASFTTVPSTDKNWSSKGTLSGRDVPAQWIRDALFSTELFPFTSRREFDRVVLPLTEDGLYDEKAESIGYWVNAESVYGDGRGKGGNTPKTLWERLDNQKGLTRQTELVTGGEGRRKVLYNASGRVGLRATRVSPNTIVSHSLYHCISSSESEAAYLTALLNADCLQEAFRQSQKTRRHFDHHFWHTVPIPKYDSRNPTHIELADLCGQAEGAAEEVRDSLPDSAGQIRVSGAIHVALREWGIARRIDDAARELMPDQAT